MTADRSPALQPLVIVGPTASGKSALAMGLAESLSGRGIAVELVSGDSMQVYRGMDIGTAKPTRAELERVPHHLIDVVEPSEEFSVGEFVTLARAAIDDIHSRNAQAIIVGGTGLYIQALVDGLDVPGQYRHVREELEATSDTTRLYERLSQLDPVAVTRIEPTNRRRIIRALEVTVGSGRPFSSFGPGMDDYPKVDFVLVGLEVDREVLTARIRARLDAQIAAGFAEEVQRLGGRAVMSRTASKALGYAELASALAGELTIDEAVSQIALRSRQFAVRQIKWFRRDPRITWFSYSEDPLELVSIIEDHWILAGT